MKRFHRAVLLAAGMLLMPGLLLAQVEPKARSSGAHVFLTFNSSFMNTFSRGNLDDFFQQTSGDAGRDVDQGSSAYMEFQFAFAFPGSDDFTGTGIGIGVELYNNRAFWGTKLDFGGRTEIALQPTILYVSLPIRIPISQNRSLFVAIDPAIQIGLLTGHLTTMSGTRYDIGPTAGIGGKLPVGLDMFFSGNIGLALRTGFRYFKADVGFKDSTSSTGYSQFTVNGEKVKADMTGVFMTMGLVVRF